MTAAPWDVVRVPFPYADRPVRQRRPAVVLATPAAGDGPGVLWVLMVTSAENRAWPGDVRIPDHGAAGLPAPSVIRTAKVATIDSRDAEPLGILAAAERRAVRAAVETHLGAPDGT